MITMTDEPTAKTPRAPEDAKEARSRLLSALLHERFGQQAPRPAERPHGHEQESA